LATELGLNVCIKPTVIFEDNQPAINITNKTTVNDSRTKHIDLMWHYVRETIHVFKAVTVQWISTTDQAADGLTKALNASKHKAFCR